MADGFSNTLRIMKIVIAGAGEIGSHIAKMLREEDYEVSVIDNDKQRLTDLASFVDVHTVYGNPAGTKCLKEVEAGKADLFLAVYPGATQETNIVAAMLARRLGAKRVIARINDEDYLSAENKLIFKEMGIEHMFYPERSAADEILGFLNHSSTSETMDFARGKLQIAVFKLDEDSPMLDLTMGDFTANLPKESLQQFRIIALSREDKTIIPGLSTKFRYGDMVFTISKKEGIPALYNCFGKKDNRIRSVMILGGSSIAKMLAERLSRQGVKVKILEKDKSRCSVLSEMLDDSVIIANVDGRNSDTLFEEGIKEYDAFVALSENDESNVLACVMARKFNVGFTVAQVENIEYIKLAEEMGVNNVVNKKLITAGRIFRFTLSGRARFVRYMTGTKAEVIEYTAAPGSAITKKPLKDLEFPANAIIGGVIRGGEAFIAVGNTRIEDYDRVAVFATPDAVKDVDILFR